MLAICSMNANAQSDGTGNVFAGFSPVAGINPSILYSPDKFSYKYKGFWLASLGYSNDIKSGGDRRKRLSWGPSVLTELNFGKAKYDHQDFDKGIPNFFDPTPEDLTYFSWNGYLGYHVTKSRFGISGLVGPGLSYMHSGPFHNLFLSPAAKVRFKVYLTNKFGIFVGGGGRYDLGFKDLFSSYGGEEDSNSSGGPYTISNPIWNLEVGLVIASGVF